jgi:hypothetical protein
MRRILPVLIVGSLWLGTIAPATPAEQQDMTALERQFHQLPMEARRLTGPLFWLHGDESPERLRMYVGKVAEGGNGCFIAESRPHSDWLGPGWYRDLAICLEAAKRHHLKMWIYDEKWWPSQAIGGKVLPRYAAKRLAATAVEVEGPRTWDAEGYGGPRYIATVAGRVTADNRIEGRSLIDLAPQIHEGKLSWQVPAGKWRIVKFSHVQGPHLSWQKKQLSIDGASKDCVDWFLQMVYQPHYDHFKADFGKTIPGYFYDEPETCGDWGTELNGVLAEWKVDWKKAYVAYKLELAGEEQIAARYQYLDAFAEAWGRTMYGGMTRWCHAHGVKSMGHFIEHSGHYHTPTFCAGDMMRLQGHSDMGAIDAIGRQFEPGKRCPDDPPTWQTPKLASSIAHVYGKHDDVTMVEIFGARGQDLGYPEMKWWTDHMQVSGINFMIPHSFNPRAPYDTDCPPYFYNGGFEPRWPLYRVFANYASRLSLMLTGGRHVCPVALLFMGQSAQVGRFIPPEDMTSALQDAQLDCDWLPYEVFEKRSSISGKHVQLYGERYKALVVPPVEVIPQGTLAKAKQFFEAGGVVIGYGFLPSKSASLGHDSAEIAALCGAIWGPNAGRGMNCCRTSAAGGRSYLLNEKPTSAQLQQVLADAGIHADLQVLDGETGGWLHVLHRVKAGQDVFLVCNQNHLGAARRFKFRATAAGEPECWDAVRNEITSIPFQRTGESTVEFSLSMESLESVLIVFSPKRQPRPLRLEAGAKPIGEPILVRRDPNPTPPTPIAANLKRSIKASLAGCKWVWFPEGNPAVDAPPGTRYFRRTITVPADRKLKRAHFLLTADNTFELYVNGKPAGEHEDSGMGDDFTRPCDVDITRNLQPGRNVLAIAATNGGDRPNPAGLIGRFTIDFEPGPPLTGTIDKSWKTSQQQVDGWKGPGLDDSTWAPARELVAFGGPPWGIIGDRPLTLSPVAAADPLRGRFVVPADVDLAKCRVCLEMDGLPDDSAAVHLNGVYAGGVIGRPSRLDVTRWLKAGENTVVIEPLAPQSARIVCYDAAEQ